MKFSHPKMCLLIGFNRYQADFKQNLKSNFQLKDVSCFWNGLFQWTVFYLRASLSAITERFFNLSLKWYVSQRSTLYRLKIELFFKRIDYKIFQTTWVAREPSVVRSSFDMGWLHFDGPCIECQQKESRDETFKNSKYLFSATCFDGIFTEVYIYYKAHERMRLTEHKTKGGGGFCTKFGGGFLLWFDISHCTR